LTKEEGGRHTPFFTGYRPQFYFRTTDVTGVISLNKGVEMVMPGDNVAVEIELISLRSYGKRKPLRYSAKAARRRRSSNRSHRIGLSGCSLPSRNCESSFGSAAK
jgi:hypothetical protein